MPDKYYLLTNIKSELLNSFSYKVRFSDKKTIFEDQFFRMIGNDLIMQQYKFQKQKGELVFIKNRTQGIKSDINVIVKPLFFGKGKIKVKQVKENLMVKIRYDIKLFFIIALIVSCLTGILTMWFSEEKLTSFFKVFILTLMVINFVGYKILKFRADRLIHPNIFTTLQLLEKDQ